MSFYEFAGFRLDLKKCLLTRGGKVVSLTPKEFEILLLLIENSGRVVKKDELLDKIWADAFVEEGTLARNISWLRKKLAAAEADEPYETKIIETLSKRGYRFLPEINQNGAASLIYQEQTIQQIQIEEIIEILPSPKDNPTEIVSESTSEKVSDTNRKALPAAIGKHKFSLFWILPVALILAAFIFVAFRGDFTRSEPQIILASKIAPFSGLPGRENSPDFSPDGKQIVFSWDGGIDGGNFDIYVKLIGAGEPVRLTETANDEINPVFSPDGKFIAFVRTFPTHNEIILIPALGGAERKLYERASYASISFSPDGKSLAAAELDLTSNSAGIFLINLQTNEKTPITRPDAPAVDHTPRFSPDGKSLAFIRYFSSFRREIFVVPATGGEPRQITSDDARIYGLAWGSDGEKLLFTSFRVVDQLNLWQIPLRGGEPKLISTGSKNLQDLAISPNGKTVAFVEETSDENIWEIRPNQKPRPLIRSTGADHSQQFSPDGNQIAFVSDRTGNYEIWLADADGRNQMQLTDAHGSAGSPRFSPDGKFIAYDAQIADAGDVYIISVNGGASVRLTENGANNSLPAWSADGNSIFFLSNRTGSNQIWKMPATGGEAVQITEQGAFEMFAAPDGKTIIYSKGNGKSGLWGVKSDGGDEKPIPELVEAGGWRSWFVSSNGVYFTAFTAQPPFHIRFFDLTNRQSKEIIGVEKLPLPYYSNLTVSPDGNKILYAQRDQSTSAITFAELN